LTNLEVDEVRIKLPMQDCFEEKPGVDHSVFEVPERPEGMPGREILLMYSECIGAVLVRRSWKFFNA
jgi:hypothetical protein